LSLITAGIGHAINSSYFPGQRFENIASLQRSLEIIAILQAIIAILGSIVGVGIFRHVK
jgi:hypothetical protein